MLKFYESNFTLGVLGGGQLGRMLIQSAMDFNIDVAVMDPDPVAPCASLAHRFVQGDLLNESDVVAFGASCDLITIEIEKVNTHGLKQLQAMGKTVFPEPDVIALIQDKREQKQFFKAHDLPTAPFVLTENKADVLQFTDWLPAVHKLGRGGYDGRGVQMLSSSDDLDKAFDDPGVLERLINVEKELSVIVARNHGGEVVSFPVVELVFHPEANLVDYLISPAQISSEIRQGAEQLARRVIDALGMTGLLAVEMFLTREGELLINEVAPRTHNSGHHTIEANVTSQFEQHLRAIIGMPLGDTRLLEPAAMVNILGEPGFEGPAQYQGLQGVLERPGVHVHLYGKKLTKPFRKMGHVTVTGADLVNCRETIDFVKQTLKVTT